jgi:hypothetical protein
MMNEEGTWRSRRAVLIGAGAAAAAYGMGLATPGLIERLRPDPIRDANEAVLPSQGHRTKLVFGDSIPRLVQAGVIDPKKFAALYATRGGLPNWVQRLFVSPSTEPIVISAATAPYLLNLLWPLGLATKTGFNADSPFKGDQLARLASTGGWRLGRAASGAGYFNAVDTLDLSEAEEVRVLAVARETFRPCCNNSAFLQDCNHGSAMLGLFELAAAQGLSEPDLFRLAKIANGYWYPAQYVAMALFFDFLEDTRWRNVDPAVVVGSKFASARGWRASIRQPLEENGLLRATARPQPAGCAA